MTEFLGLFDSPTPPTMDGNHGPSWWRDVQSQQWRAYAGALASPGPGWTALTPLNRIEGASPSEAAAFHYVVETDIPPHAEADFNAWYDTEHLPGLARVPGTVLARRYRRDTGGPRYIACYDIQAPEVLERPEWLAIRHTPWSARIRPLFLNTRRLMHARVPPALT